MITGLSQQEKQDDLVGQKQEKMGKPLGPYLAGGPS